MRTDLEAVRAQLALLAIGFDIPSGELADAPAQALALIDRLQRRAEEAERERDELRGKYDFVCSGLAEALDQLAAKDADADEAHKIGIDEGRQEMAREIDLATGGDGEFRYCTDHDLERHCPDAVAMRDRIIVRFDNLTEALAARDKAINEAIALSQEYQTSTVGHLLVALQKAFTHQPTTPATGREPLPSSFFDHDEAIEWITANCMTIRRDNGAMDYSLGAMIKAYEAGKASQIPAREGSV